MRKNKAKISFKLADGVNYGYEIFSKIDPKLQKYKKQVLLEVAKDIVKRADYHIELNRMATFTPPTKKLINSVNYNVTSNNLRITVGDSTTPYAGIHNLPEGTTYTIHAKSGAFKSKSGRPMLAFYWYRIGRSVKAFSVDRPGTEFFTKSWRETIYNINDYFKYSKSKDLYS